MDQKEANFSKTVTLITELAGKIYQDIQKTGRKLNAREIKIAKIVGVKNPEKIRIFSVSAQDYMSYSVYEKLKLKEWLDVPPIDQIGFVYSYSIILKKERKLTLANLSRAFRFVTYFESFLKMEYFFQMYIKSIMNFGFQGSPFSIDNKRIAQTSALLFSLEELEEKQDSTQTRS